MTKQHVDASPSSTGIWLNCPASVTKARGRTRVATIYTKEGTAAHLLAEKWLRSKSRSMKPQMILVEGEEIPVTEEMLDAVETYVKYVKATAKGCELHIETRVHIESAGEPLSGTSDAFIIAAKGKALEVIDFKYGQGVAVSADSSQLRIYALGVLESLGPFAEIDTVMLTVVQPRINPDPYSKIIPVTELNEWEANILSPALARLSAGDMTETPGDHCRWCVRAGECQALATKAMEVAKMTFDPIPPDPAGLSDDELARVLDAAALIGDWIAKVRAEASARIDSGGDIPGWKLVAKRASRKWSDGMGVIHELVRHGVDVMDIVRVETIGHVEKVMKRCKVPASVIEPFTVKESSGSTLVSERDSRMALDTSAKNV